MIDIIAFGHIKDLNDIYRINEIAQKLPYEMSISCGREMYDAKSFIALFNLIGRDVTFVVEDWVDKKDFQRALRKMKLRP